jgi:hypothetical protein
LIATIESRSRCIVSVNWSLVDVASIVVPKAVSAALRRAAAATRR